MPIFVKCLKFVCGEYSFVLQHLSKLPARLLQGKNNRRKEKSYLLMNASDKKNRNRFVRKRIHKKQISMKYLVKHTIGTIHKYTSLCKI